MDTSRTFLRQALVILALAGFTLALVFVLVFKNPFQNGSAPLIANAAPLDKREIVSAGKPVRLKIPKLAVDAPIDPMGTLQNGDMEAPNGPSNVGWFKAGPHPGNSGSAVIAGHSGRWKSGGGSVFDDLHKLSKGDSIYAEDEKGATTTFEVRENRKYDPEADASEVFRSSDGKSHLNLVTCEGAWNEAEQTFSARLVVFADKK